MIEITVPIYYKEIVPRARKNPMLGMNWLLGAANTFKRNGKTTSAYAGIKKKIHEIVLERKEEILKTNGGVRLGQDNGYHVEYEVYLKRKGSDGTNVRAFCEKVWCDALQEADIIDDDKFIYSTSSKFFLDRVGEPRCIIRITQLKDYEFEIK